MFEPDDEPSLGHTRRRSIRAQAPTQLRSVRVNSRPMQMQSHDVRAVRVQIFRPAIRRSVLLFQDRIAGSAPVVDSVGPLQGRSLRSEP
jgi:hypothetical protein